MVDINNNIYQFDSVIFDIDGTIWDTSVTLTEAYQAASEKFGFKKPLQIGSVQSLLGRTNDEIFRSLFPEISKTYTQEDADRIYDGLIEQAVCYVSDLINRRGGLVYKGIEDTLAYLSSKTKIYIVSNCESKYIEQLFDFTGFEKYFSGAMCHEDTGLDKGHTIKALIDRFDLKEPVYVGDADTDANACIFAGIPFIYAEYGFGNVNKEKYIFRIERPDELIGKLSFR